MQPTMKLRWRLAEHGETCFPFGDKWNLGMSDELDRYQGRILQQLWIAPEGAINTPDEWRDIEITEEE